MLLVSLVGQAMKVTRRNVVRGMAGVLALEAVGLAGHSRIGAADQPTARVVTGLRSMVQGVAWVGAEAGIFSGIGVDVRFPKLETAGPEAAAGLIRGDWELAEVGISPVVQGALDGQDTVILAQALPTTRGTSLIVRKGITEAAQLNGTRIGVLTEAGQTTLVVRAALRELGINGIFVPLGTFAKITAAVAAGEVDAGTVGIEYRLAARQRFGLDSIALSGGLGASILASTRRLLTRDRALVARVVEGYVRAIHLLKTQRTAALPLIERFLRDFDRSTVEAIYEFFAPRWQPLPKPAADGIQAVLDELASRYPAARTLAPEAFVDTSFLHDLERSGFVTRLYAR